MSENDYIAEYVKERHPGLLGADFQLWKMARKLYEVVYEVGKAIREAIKDTPPEDIGRIMNESEE